jgi:NADH-ubiquinone oxidoreductase chain 1
MARGWSSNRNYALLGAIRGVAQTISYEVRIALIFLSFIFILGSFKLVDFRLHQTKLWFIILFYPLFLCWLASILAETNRTPFDFAEGESELVSGFNIEYGRGGFALLFLAEYGSIIFIRYLVRIIFLGGSYNIITTSLIGCFFCYWFI